MYYENTVVDCLFAKQEYNHWVYLILKRTYSYLGFVIKQVCYKSLKDSHNKNLH